MNLYSFYRGQIDPSALYRAWYGHSDRPEHEVTFRQERRGDGTVALETTAKRLIPGGRLTGIQGVKRS